MRAAILHTMPPSLKIRFCAQLRVSVRVGVMVRNFTMLSKEVCHLLKCVCVLCYVVKWVCLVSWETAGRAFSLALA